LSYPLGHEKLQTDLIFKQKGGWHMETELMTLSDNQVIHYRTLLENRKKAIYANEESLKRKAFYELLPEDTGELSKIRLHPADLATDTQEVEILETLSARNLVAIQEVEAALERLENGTYGQCLSCHEPITAARLAIIPETRHCIDCEQEIEAIKKTNTLLRA
jgi:RNA polymerase-binding transcription factor DksA